MVEIIFASTGKIMEKTEEQDQWDTVRNKGKNRVGHNVTVWAFKNGKIDVVSSMCRKTKVR